MIDEYDDVLSWIGSHALEYEEKERGVEEEIERIAAGVTSYLDALREFGLKNGLKSALMNASDAHDLPPDHRRAAAREIKRLDEAGDRERALTELRRLAERSREEIDRLEMLLEIRMRLRHPGPPT